VPALVRFSKIVRSLNNQFVELLQRLVLAVAAGIQVYAMGYIAPQE
jgi:hypothetical protein